MLVLLTSRDPRPAIVIVSSQSSAWSITSSINRDLTCQYRSRPIDEFVWQNGIQVQQPESQIIPSPFYPAFCVTYYWAKFKTHQDAQSAAWKVGPKQCTYLSCIVGNYKIDVAISGTSHVLINGTLLPRLFTAVYCIHIHEQIVFCVLNLDGYVYLLHFLRYVHNVPLCGPERSGRFKVYFWWYCTCTQVCEAHNWEKVNPGFWSLFKVKKCLEGL